MLVALRHQLLGAAQDLAAHAGACGGPSVLRGDCRIQGGASILHRRVGDLDEHLSGAWIDDRQRGAGLGVRPLAVEQQAARSEGQRRALGSVVALTLASREKPSPRG